MVPSAGAWSFSIDASQLPFAFAFPTGAKAGDIIFTATSNSGSTPIDPEGVIGSVVIDGGAPLSTACLENGSESIAIPPGSATLVVSAVYGCGAGPDPTTLVVSGVGA